MPPSLQIDNQPDQHAKAREAKAVVPAVLLAEQTRHDRREERARVDRRVIDLERIGPPAVVGGVQRADLRNQVTAQASGAEREQQQREQERRIERHAEVPDRHHQGAQCHRAVATEYTVAEQTAEQRCQVHRADVETEDLEGERLRRQWPREPLDRGPERSESDDVLDMSGQQQLLHHVQREQRLHAVERDAVPELRTRKHDQPLGMPKDIRARRTCDDRQRCGLRAGLCVVQFVGPRAAD